MKKNTEKMSFGTALDNLLNYNRTRIICMRLPKWSEDVVIKVEKPKGVNGMTSKFLYVESRFGSVPWIPTQIEMLSEEWELWEI